MTWRQHVPPLLEHVYIWNVAVPHYTFHLFSFISTTVETTSTLSQTLVCSIWHHFIMPIISRHKWHQQSSSNYQSRMVTIVSFQQQILLWLIRNLTIFGSLFDSALPSVFQPSSGQCWLSHSSQSAVAAGSSIQCKSSDKPSCSAADGTHTAERRLAAQRPEIRCRLIPTDRCAAHIALASGSQLGGCLELLDQVVRSTQLSLQIPSLLHCPPAIACTHQDKT